MTRTSFPCRIRLTWNGTTVLEGGATTVCALDVARAHFADNFTGPELKPFLERAFGPGVLDRLLKDGADPESGCYGDATGSAAFHIERA